MVNRFLALICCLASVALFAQQPQTTEQAVTQGGMPRYVKPETPEQRQARVGTQEDPGLDPDPNKIFWRYGLELHIHKYPLKTASFDEQPTGWIRPYGPANISAEIYQLNDEYVWVWWPAKKIEPQEELAPERPPLTKEAIDYLVAIQPEYSELTPLDSGTTVRFVESSEGLPQTGSWRNALDVADMNGDGHLDIVVPAERQRPATPNIFLGDGKGKWTPWKTVWPYTIDYGAVAAGDFNKDGHMDVVAAIHLVGLRAFLGDGKGNFTDASEGLPSNFPARRVALADVDRDGDTDILAIHEGPTAISTSSPDGRIRAFLNTNKGAKWEGIDVAEPIREFGGDYLAIGNFNGDRYPDMFGSSVYLNGSDLLYLSGGKTKWKNVGGGGQLLPLFSTYYATATGKFISRQRDDVAVSFVRVWPGIDPRFVSKPKLTNVTGIDLINFDGKAPRRQSVVRWSSEIPVRGLAAADFDGDGNVDLIYTPQEPRAVEILLGNGRGEFKRAEVEGLELSENFNYDVKIADVNKDRRPDVILMYETDDTKNAFAPRDGKIQVFLGQGAVKETTAKK